jgi:hypothetical protein
MSLKAKEGEWECRRSVICGFEGKKTDSRFERNDLRENRDKRKEEGEKKRERRS